MSTRILALMVTLLVGAGTGGAIAIGGAGGSSNAASAQYKPGNGCGDKNHTHTGPPGNPGNHKCPPQSGGGNGDGNGGHNGKVKGKCNDGVAASGPRRVGNMSVGSFSNTFSADRKWVNRYSLPQSGSMSKLCLYLAPTSSTTGQTDIEGVVYADSGGAPRALLGTSSQIVFTARQAAGWYDLSFPSPVSLSAGRYWIGVLTGGTPGVAGFRYANLPGGRNYNPNPHASGPTNPFGSFSTDGEQMSLYAAYKPGP